MVKKTGAPKGSGSKFTKAIADRICNHISEGLSLRSFCAENKLPYRTVMAWVQEHESFAAQYARARDIGYDVIAEEIRDISDTPVPGVTKTFKADGSVEAKEEDMLGHRKLQIETRLKLLACWNPKKYGSRITHAGDPLAPIPLVLNGSDVEG